MKRSHRLVTSALFFSLALGLPTAAYAQTDDTEDWGDEEDDDDGDDDFDVEDVDIGSLTVAPPKPLSLRGFIRTELGLWTERFDENPFAKGRQSVDFILTGRHDFLQFKGAVHAEYDFAYLHERDSYDEPTLEAYEWQILTRDVFLAFSLGKVELTIGRQIVAWGEGDALSPLDVVNPRDMREPGLADLDDIRMAVLATRVGLFVGDHRIEVMVLHEANFGLRSPPYGPFSPLPALFESNPAAAGILAGKTLDYDDRESQFDISVQQPMFRWVYKGPGIDLGAYWAYILDKQGVLRFPTDPAQLGALLANDRVELRQEHPYYTVLGTSGAYGIDALLIKWEVGAQIARSFNTGKQEDITSFEVQHGTLLDVMVGVTWQIDSDTMLALEAHKPIFLDEPDDLLFPVDEMAVALRFSWTGLKERLNINLAISVLGLDTQFEKAIDGEPDF
ncbi:MAG: hypothetical protein ACI9OJ_001861, partial [Myxococcota bacterium]